MKTKKISVKTTIFSIAVALALFAMLKPSEAEVLDTKNMSETMIVSGSAKTLIAPPKNRFGDTPEDSATCVRNISLYTEYYNQRNFEMAYDFWREVFQHCPQAQQNTYIRGAVLLKMKYNQETDPVKREAWVDTLMMLYDKRIEHFGHTNASREGSVLAKKAVDMFQFRPNNILEIYEISKKAIDLEGNKSQADVILVHMNSVSKLIQAGLKEPEEMLTAYDQIMGIIDYNIKNNPEDADRYFKPAKTNVELMFEPYATCDNIITLFGDKYEENPDDVELLRKITSMLEKSGCTSEELFFNATKSLHSIEPNAESAFLMGRLENTNENFEKALEYFQQAADLYESEEDMFSTYLLMSDISFRALRNYVQARDYALEASSLNPEDGRPYILIGEMYASTATSCGDNELTKTVAYWAAVDKFVQARNVDSDPEIQERATELINTYSQYFPNQETAFFYGLTEGDSYRVGCWINETTRVRF